MKAQTPSNSSHVDVNAAYRISLASAVWSVAASTGAVALGAGSHTAVLVALGAVGFVDAIGSAVLAYHFGHALRRKVFAERLERLAHTTVLVGLAVVGSGAMVGGIIRLVLRETGNASVAGIALAVASLIALLALTAGKLVIARRIGSAALRSDGHLSAVGATQAAIAVIGTVVGVSWADAAATFIVGAFAVSLAASTWIRR